MVSRFLCVLFCCPSKTSTGINNLDSHQLHKIIFSENESSLIGKKGVVHGSCRSPSLSPLYTVLIVFIHAIYGTVSPVTHRPDFSSLECGYQHFGGT